MKPREPSPLWYVLIFVAGIVPASWAFVFLGRFHEQFPDGDLPVVLLVTVFFGAFVGGPAALVTGALAAVLPVRLSAITYLAACATIGATCEALWIALFMDEGRRPSEAWPAWAFAAGTAALCAFVTLPLRKRRTTDA